VRGPVVIPRCGMLWCVRTRVCMCWSLLCAVHYASSATTSTVCENTGSYHYYRTGRPLYSEGTSHSADSGSNLVGDKFAVAQSAKRGRKPRNAKCEIGNWGRCSDASAQARGPAGETERVIVYVLGWRWLAAVLVS
jgi:hypothetical protein